ncbi:MAG TPA: ribbon-helix-helix protein, CopG family [Anaerolineaceae bacterium]|nr:ribbon-helix-helix protein, CopG family [Anaerolineaceae bacterium]
MIRNPIQLTEEQLHALKRIAAKEGKSVAELVRVNVDDLIRRSVTADPQDLRQPALQLASKLTGPKNLEANHDAYLDEALDQ